MSEEIAYRIPAEVPEKKKGTDLCDPRPRYIRNLTEGKVVS